MKTINIEAMNRMDPDDLKDAADASGRKALRIAIIKNFLSWANKSENKGLWQTAEASIEDTVVLKRHRNFKKMMGGFGLFANFFLY